MKSKSPMLDKAMASMKQDGLLPRPRKPRRRKEAPDWFGCGRVITQESWDGFLAARRAYYEQQDKLCAPVRGGFARRPRLRRRKRVGVRSFADYSGSRILPMFTRT